MVKVSTSIVGIAKLHDCISAATSDGSVIGDTRGDIRPRMDKAREKLRYK
jgi:hypothetical protein